MTTPQQTQPPPDVQVGTVEQDQSSIVPVILASIATYLALKQVVKGPWRNVAAMVGLTGVAGNALDRLARRGMVRMGSRAGKRAAATLWAAHEKAVAAGVDAGLQGLVKVILGVQDRLDEARRLIEQAHTDPALPLPKFDPDAATPRAVVSRLVLLNTAADLVDAVIYATQNTAAQLTQNWTKQWKSRGDSRVRPAHQDLDGVTIPALETFRSPAGDIRFPHDPAAPLSQVINCRCRLEFAYERVSARAASPVVPAGQGRDRMAAGAYISFGHRWARVDPDG